MKGKVLITGGTGFIGYHLSKEFLKRNYKVTSISLTKPKKKRYLRNMNYLYCDLGNYNALKKTIVGDFDYVINLAGHVDHTNKAKVINSHFNGCKNLSTIFLKRKIKGFFQIGSCVEYGYKASPQKENAKIKLNTIRSNYGISKYLATKYLLNLHQKKKFPVIILRLYLIYGPRQDTNRLIPIVLQKCKRRQGFPCSEGSQMRDFLHINDLVNLFFKIIQTSRKNYFGNIYNVGFGKPYSVKNVIMLIKKIVKGGKPNFGKIKLRKDEITELYPDINKIKDYFKWKPKIGLKKGISLLVNYDK